MAHLSKWAIGLLCLVASGCGRAPDTYPMPLHEVYERLTASTLDALKADRQCGILIHIRSEGQVDRSVTWRIFSSGREMLSFTAVLTPVDARHTRVAVEMPQGPDGREVYDGTRTYLRPAVAQPARPAVAEQVAALLDGRPYDAGRLPPAPRDTVCDVQRAGLEAGTRFTVVDRPGERASTYDTTAILEDRRRDAERKARGW